MRKTWDAIYESAYPGSSVAKVPLATWVENAWWRHNIFTKMFATDTKFLWTDSTQQVSSIVPSKEQSDHENSLGRKSLWLQTALQRLKKMPVFGLHHRLKESFELMGFRLCFPVSMKYFNKQWITKAEVKAVVDKYNQLDNLLLQEAESLFNEMVSDMRAKKAKGIICDVGAVLERPGLEMGLQCTNTSSN
jgi:hypothetical protein